MVFLSFGGGSPMNHKAYQTARFTSAFALVAGTLGLSTAACTGDDSANHVISDPPIPAEIVLIDDFETGAGAQPAIMTPSFTGNHWYKYDDHTLDAPDGGAPDAAAPGQQVVAFEALPEPHPTINGPSAHALHITGGSFQDWGAGVTGGLAGDGNVPYDASAYSGIMFWAMRGQSTTSNAMTVAIPTTNDSPVDGGPCHNPETPGKHDRCSDSFHKDITLRSSWTLYIVYFSDLAQSGWGYIPPGGFGKRGAMGIAFSNKGVSSKGGDPFDEWIDDLAFFK
jgi:hypothetical protein